MRSTPHMLSRVLLAALLAAGTAGAADQVSPVDAPAKPGSADARHEEALQAIFLETRVLPMARNAIVAQVKPGYQRQLVEFFFRTHSDADLAGAYARTVAPSISPSTSAGALRVVRTPQMRQMMAQYELLAKLNPANMTPTPAIRRLAGEVERAATPADLQAMARVTPFSKGVAPFIAKAIREQDNALARQLQTRLGEMVKLSWRADLKAEQIPRGRIGFAPIDRVTDVWVASLERAVAASDEQRQGYARLGFDTLLEARYLTSREGIERGRKIIDEAERINQAYLAATQDNYASRIEALRAAFKELPNYAEKNADAQVSEKIGFLIDVNEMRQRTYAVYRRMLSFAESRLGQTTLEGATMVFASDADLAIWRDMQGEVQQLAAQDAEKHRVLLQKEGQVSQESAQRL